QSYSLHAYFIVVCLYAAAQLPVKAAGGNRNGRTALLPLYGGGRLRRNVVGHARDARDLVEDPVGDVLQEVVRQVRPARRHEVHRLDGAQGNHVVVAAGVALDAHGPDRQEDGEGLADVVVEVVDAQLLDEDGIRLPQAVRVLLLHFAQDAHAEAGTGEGMALE